MIGNQTGNLLVYGTTLQSTEPPRPGHEYCVFYKLKASFSFIEEIVTPFIVVVWNWPTISLRFAHKHKGDHNEIFNFQECHRIWRDNVKALREAQRECSYQTVSYVEVMAYPGKGKASGAKKAWVGILAFPFWVCDLGKHT